MNKTAELVNLWAAFEEIHPEAGIDDFCRHHLASKREKKLLFDGELPPRPDIALTKLMDRFARLHMIYIQTALEDMELQHFEEFSLLSAIANLQMPRKTEVIYHTINELSTGLSLLKGLEKKGYIKEKDDMTDKRSKRLSLTKKGEQVLQNCYIKFSMVPEMLFMEMRIEDIELCIQLLKNIDIKFSKLWQNHKGKPFSEVYSNITGRNP